MHICNFESSTYLYLIVSDCILQCISVCICMYLTVFCYHIHSHMHQNCGFYSPNWQSAAAGRTRISQNQQQLLQEYNQQHQLQHSHPPTACSSFCHIQNRLAPNSKLPPLDALPVLSSSSETRRTRCSYSLASLRECSLNAE